MKLLNNIPNSIKNSPYPLTKLNLEKFEGLQNGIPLFENVKLKDIAFVTKRFETLDLFRGCNVACMHCLKDAKPIKNGTILFEDLERFLDGFKIISERFGFNVFQGNKYLNIIDDSNPSDIPIKGKSRDHSVVEAMKLIYEKIKLPTIFVTSGWNKASKYAQSTANELVRMIKRDPDSVVSVEVSINPFSGLMEKSRNALNKSKQSEAEFYKKIYTDRMANTLAVFLELFENGKASIIYRHAPNYKGNELVDEKATRELYQEIYNKLKYMSSSSLENVPQLKPENLTKFDKTHLIESSGRGRQYFPLDMNMKEQSELIDEVLRWNNLSKAEKMKELLDYAIKAVDINGDIYTTFPANHVDYISAPIEITVPTNIRLNYENKPKLDSIFSDIEVI